MFDLVCTSLILKAISELAHTALYIHCVVLFKRLLFSVTNWHGRASLRDRSVVRWEYSVTSEWSMWQHINAVHLTGGGSVVKTHSTTCYWWSDERRTLLKTGTFELSKHWPALWSPRHPIHRGLQYQRTYDLRLQLIMSTYQLKTRIPLLI